MRRLFSIFLLVFLLLSFCGCSTYRTDITMDEIIAVYEDAGYSVWSEVYDEKLDFGSIASIQANHPNGDYIYFDIFESQADAQACKEACYHPVAVGLFSILYGDPSWLRWDVYGCVLVQFDDPALFEPFKTLLKGNKE